MKKMPNMNMHRQTLNLGVAGLLQFTPKGETHAALAPDDGTTKANQLRSWDAKPRAPPGAA